MKDVLLVGGGLIMGMGFGYGIVIFSLNNLFAKMTAFEMRITQLSHVLSIWQGSQKVSPTS